MKQSFPFVLSYMLHSPSGALPMNASGELVFRDPKNFTAEQVRDESFKYFTRTWRGQFNFATVRFLDCALRQTRADAIGVLHREGDMPIPYDQITAQTPTEVLLPGVYRGGRFSDLSKRIDYCPTNFLSTFNPELPGNAMRRYDIQLEIGAPTMTLAALQERKRALREK